MGERETVWELEHHTAAKHEILKRYLAAWFPILTVGGFNRRVLFLDGFAGPGVYSKGEKGSPIVALETLVTHALFPKLTRTEFLFLFIENHTARYENLLIELDAFWERHGGQPGNVRVEVRNSEFADVAEEIVVALAEQKQKLAPTFAFIDPFGWSGVPLAKICALLAFDKCEVFFNFMYDSLNRFVTHPDDKIHRHLADLFGTDEYRQADGLDPSDRKRFLHDLYRRQLGEAGGFSHVHSFEMINHQGHTAYSLFFGTRSIDGLRVMKDAMWAVDPVDGLRFSDRLAGMPILFEPEPNFGPLARVIFERFDGRTVRVEEVEEFVLVETPYKASHYKKQVLKPLQADGGLLMVSGQKKRGTFPAGTIMKFASP